MSRVTLYARMTELMTRLANCGEHHEMSAKQERARRRQQEGR